VAVLSFASRLPQVLVHNALLVPAFGLLIGTLADASCALYVLHVPLLYRFMALGFGGDARGVRLRHVAAFAIGAIALSIAAFTWIEEPLRRRLRGSRSRLEGRRSVG
jgi:peptidoglycan/LPS O-acetylase OafA/YrhL